MGGENSVFTMNRATRIKDFNNLGSIIHDFLAKKESDRSSSYSERFEIAIRKSCHLNGWFDEKSVRNSLEEIANWLDQNALEEWLSAYEAKLENLLSKRILVIMAGNIPAVGFHDVLSVLITGHKLIAKLSSKDKILIPFLLELLTEINNDWKSLIEISENRKTQIEGVIATGSDNSARYFEFYFGKYPHIIRKNRTSVAVLTGNESKEELRALGKDIFSYYGLGCRNVTKLFVPESYQFDFFFESIVDYSDVLKNNKYYNNYEYNRTIYLLNSEEGLLDNNFLLLKPERKLNSPIGVLGYDFYEDEKDLESKLIAEKENLQVVVGKKYTQFGDAQKPKLNDYADEVNSIDFLTSL